MDFTTGEVSKMKEIELNREERVQRMEDNSQKGKLRYVHGVMGSNKSLDLIKVADNYLFQGRDILLMTPSIDTRSGLATIKSRTMMFGRKAIQIDVDDNLYAKIQTKIDESPRRIYAVLIDEAQFLTREQVKQLVELTTKQRITVFCFGLKNSYIDDTLFEGSESLLYYADEITENVTMCLLCESKATQNLLIENGVPKRTGADTINIGDIGTTTMIKQYYIPCCNYHYLNADINNIEESRIKVRNVTELREKRIEEGLKEIHENGLCNSNFNL